MKLACAIATGIACIVFSASSAEVAWGCFNEQLQCYQYGNSHGFWIDLNISVAPSGADDTIVLSADGWVLEFMGNWVAAVLGDVACETTTRHLDEYFAHSYIDNTYEFGDRLITGSDNGELLSHGSITASKGNDQYLMFAVQSTDLLFGREQSVYYGWVQLLVGIDGTVSVGNSAIDLSGGPMIVGGGSALTPEPTGATMLLLGGCALTLRRKK